MRSFIKKDSRLLKREIALKSNLKKRKKLMEETVLYFNLTLSPIVYLQKMNYMMILMTITDTCRHGFKTALIALTSGNK